ncbi:MAG: hypothetical protein ACON5H_02415 [Akkermansiaceae bacterium]
MTYSLVITALIIGIAAFFGHSQNKKLTELRTQWENIRSTGNNYEIPEDPDADFSPTRIAERRKSLVRKGEVTTFTHQLIAFMKEMKTAQKNGDGNNLEIQQRGMDLFLKLTEFSAGEIKHLIELVMADTTLEDQSKTEMVMGSLMFLSNEQPETALTILLETKGKLLKDSRFSDHFTGMAVGKLAAENPLAALEWMQEHQDDLGGISDELRQQVISSAAQKDLQAAFSLINEMEFENESAPFWGLAQNVTAENADEFLAGIRRLDVPPEEMKNALSSLSNSPLWRDHEAAISWIEKAELTTEETHSVINGLHYHSARGNIASWLDWLDDQKGSAYSGKSKQLMREWVFEDSRAAGEWVNGLEKGPRRDDAAYQYASVLKSHEPEAAREWAESLPDGERKRKLLKEIKIDP